MVLIFIFLLYSNLKKSKIKTNFPSIILQVQTIVDHHHASDQNRSATKVRFSEPGEEKDEGGESKVRSSGKLLG